METPWSRLGDAARERLAPLPRALAILLENILAHEGDPAPFAALFEDWLAKGASSAEIPFRPSRILLQDTAGVAVLADLAALRDHHADAGGAPEAVDALLPVDLVIDHSVRVDHSGTPEALEANLALEYARNGERYAFFKWAERAFPRLRVVPPGNGICHQINLEELSEIAVPVPGHPGWTGAETVIGTDSHTTMVNALGILGWGVGGLEAEMAALGEPLSCPLPCVTGVRLTGARPAGLTATDIALHIAARLRAAGVVDHIVEFEGDALDALTLPDRAAIANMCPEYGATAALFPVDDATLAYLAAMGRGADAIARYRGYAHAAGLWRDAGPPRRYSRVIAIALDALEPVMAGPSRPQQVRRLSEVPASVEGAGEGQPAPLDRARACDGAVAIAAITSCTNTANPGLMIAAGLLARNAVARGLAVPPWVKTSLAPGSRRIARLLDEAGLQPGLDRLGFHLVGFGCTTCVGNSGELKPGLEGVGLLTAILSGNRNFENRIHPAVRANYLASPPMVVAGALAGNLRIDLGRDPVGFDRDGAAVMLADIWPGDAEIAALLEKAGMGAAGKAADAAWDALESPPGLRFPWDPASSFIRRPPFFAMAPARPGEGLRDARVLLALGDAVTTDHISPIGRIAADSPAGRHLIALGEAPARLGSYGDRRANHEVMWRGTFDNARLDNALAGGRGNRAVAPGGAILSVFDAAAAWAEQGVPLVIFAGDAYGTGSARDWAAKGTALLGVRAVIARSFERIHRDNLIAMGVVPVALEEALPAGALTPETRVDVLGLESLGRGDAALSVVLRDPGGGETVLAARAAIATASQRDRLLSGGHFARMRTRGAGG
ncbi:aconitate hydratase AcnA [Sphingomonas canadensis]|uniref:Aconitate hydratase A n=1 Tax=Sphingomonas canadensis TaxID=1219257 RepID=A0ABW3H899_9SPHN|nr:aconitate hydratase AcnA [Sphingomonas canadensis]MCW3834422.1 aconitate hydratase AcnA [Sphingomonas canadensis]